MKKMSTLLVVFFLFAAFSYGQAPRNTHFKSRSITGFRHFFGAGAHHFHLPPQVYHFKNALNLHKQKLDSIVFHDADDPEDNEKLSFHYDAFGNLSEYAEWEIADAGGWEMDGKFSFSYNTEGKMDSIMVFFPDSLGNLLPIDLEVFTYTDGKLTRDVESYYDTDSLQWLEEIKDIYTYDSSGRLVEAVEYDNPEYQTVIKTSTAWAKSKKTTWTYDDKGNVATITDYDWDSGQWVADSKDDYTFSNGKLTGDVSSSWDSNSGTWSGEDKYIYSYDNQGRFVQEIDYTMHIVKGEWTKQSKSAIQYDSEGNFATETDYDWDASSGQWRNSDKQEMKYNNTYSFSDLVLPVYVLSDMGGKRGGRSSNKSAAQSEKTNDGFYPEESFTPSPINFRMYFVHMWISENDYSWDTKTGTWTKNDEISLHYSKFDVTGVRKNETRHLEILPNPASGHITVTLPRHDAQNFTFELFDVQGRKVLSQKVTNHARINLQYLQNGVYFYRAVFRGEKFTGKILKK